MLCNILLGTNIKNTIILLISIYKVFFYKIKFFKIFHAKNIYIYIYVYIYIYNL